MSIWVMVVIGVTFPVCGTLCGFFFFDLSLCDVPS